MARAMIIADANVNRRQAIASRIVTDAEIHECADNRTLLKIVTDMTPAVVVIGSLGDNHSQAIEAAHLIRRVHPAAKVIFIADQSSETIAIDALRAGVFEYLKAPVDPVEIAE